MSSRQGQSLDQETLEKMREENRQRNVERAQNIKQEREGLKANREKIKNKLQTAFNNRTKKSIWDQHSYNITFGVIGGVILLVIVSQLFSGTGNFARMPVLEDEFIRGINEDQRTYRAKANSFFEGWTVADARNILNNGFTQSDKLSKCEAGSDLALDRYNFRKEHMYCTAPIYNQQNCSSAFAVAGVSSFNDRFCLINNGLKKLDGSIQHALSCDKKNSNGCRGGFVTGPFELARAKGLVTSMCMTYNPNTADTCDVEHLKKCHRRKADSFCIAEGVAAIKAEIQKNGPVSSMMPVTREFLVYGSGIYDVTPGISIFNARLNPARRTPSSKDYRMGHFQ